jgi:TolB protein
MKLHCIVFLGFAMLLGQTAPVKVRSILHVVDLKGRDKEIVRFEQHVEAPNWHADGKRLLVNSGGQLFWVDLAAPALVKVSTGSVTKINNDHGISADGKTIVFSAGHIYTVASTGGTPKQVTSLQPSYFHGWSPDGKRLAYCARRDDNFDIYDIDVNGGPERRLTTHAEADDGCDYSPDGKWLYFNSRRTGNWDIWRMPADGAKTSDQLAESVTHDEYEDWFPHPSPSGRWMTILSYAKGTLGHPANQQVKIRLFRMNQNRMVDPKPRITIDLFGGQGSINVNSWSPDSKQFAYLSYELM